MKKKLRSFFLCLVLILSSSMFVSAETQENALKRNENLEKVSVSDQINKNIFSIPVENEEEANKLIDILNNNSSSFYTDVYRTTTSDGVSTHALETARVYATPVYMYNACTYTVDANALTTVEGGGLLDTFISSTSGYITGSSSLDWVRVEFYV